MNGATKLNNSIEQLSGPILVLGASGFIGANLFRLLLANRHDVYGTATRLPAWRLKDLPAKNVYVSDLLIDSNLNQLLDSVQPLTIFNCAAYGGYSFETDSQLIYRTNFGLASRLLAKLEPRAISCYLQAGSSSEYGTNAAGPREDAFVAPNSHYSVSKLATSNLLYYYGKSRNFPCANLRFYSVYGPLEDASRLIPSLIRYASAGHYPEFVDANISRDFIYIDDACTAFVETALALTRANYGESFNVGTGVKTTIAELAAYAHELFTLAGKPLFTMPSRHWDVKDWYADISKIRTRIGWQASVSLGDGLRSTIGWYEALTDKEDYAQSSKKFELDTKRSVTAVVACFKNAKAIPIMYDRLRSTFVKLNIDYEIIFVNDCSPDEDEEAICLLSRNDPRVHGISHSRNFGSQAAFRSGMEIATKNACVLLDGDLQDPPELIDDFVIKWRDGYDVVYGVRVKREAPVLMQIAYKAFYRVFDRFSCVHMPHDAGDFSLLDRRVVEAILRFPERGFFLRGIRAYAGFRQTGVDYVRPARLYGVSTNSFWRNVGWAKKGILAFSYVPLNMMSAAAIGFSIFSLVLMIGQTLARILFPAQAPRGVTTVLLVILFFGSLNLLAVSLIGEYLAKIFEEVKQRPHYIRRGIIKDGDIRSAGSENGPGHII